MRKKPSLSAIAVGLCCVLVIVPAICSIWYFNRVVSDRLEATARETVGFYLEQFSEHTGSILDTLRGSIYYLMNDEDTQRIMGTDGPPTRLERLAVEEGLGRAFLIGNALDPSAVTGIYLVKNGQEYLSILRGGLLSGTARRVLHVFEQNQDANSARELYTDPAYPGYCYFIVDYFDLHDMQVLGKIIIELNVDALLDTSSIDQLYQQAVVLLSSTDGRIISGRGQAQFLEAAAGQADGYLTVEDAAYYHAGQSLSPSRVRLDIFIPQDEIFLTIKETNTVYIIFTVAMLLVTLGLGALAATVMLGPLRQMLGKIDRLATGDLAVRMPSTPYAETEHMAQAFNDMADRLEDLFDEVYTKGLLLRDAEFSLLESQIRPHFIFNVLELINMRCLAAGEHGICQIVSNLAQLLRANITHKHVQTISFQEELRYVRYYLELQKERFGAKLTYEISLEDPDILRYYLPKLTIQPLVENSIVHGLENKREGGFVHIGIWEEEDAVCVRVADDGIGFDAGSIDWTEDTPGQESETHNHVALRNIARRITLLYGKRYGMHIDSKPGKGTDIILTLPVDHGSEKGEESGCSNS